MNFIGMILICIFLIGCRSIDPVVGSWKTFDDTVIVLAADGKGMQTFEKEGYFELNGSYEGLETELSWEKKEGNIYTIYYHFEEFISPDEAELKEGKLIFDQGDYLNILTKVEPVDGGQQISLALIYATSHRSAKEMNHDSLHWTVTEGVSEELPIMIRYLESRNEIGKESYPHRLNVFWSLRSPDENGLPSKSDFKETESFEDRIVEAIDDLSHTILCLVLTGKKKREYVFQTRDPELFLQALTSMPQEQEKYPIEILHTQDESWDYFERVISGIKPTKAEPVASGQRR